MKQYFETPLQKEMAYVAPNLEVIEITPEGALCAASGNFTPDDWDDNVPGIN